MRVEVSLLSEPEFIEFRDEADALAQLVPGRDGVIFFNGCQRATFLPQVWEQLPERRQFMAALKAKAGRRWISGGPNVMIARYQVQKWHEGEPTRSKTMTDHPARYWHALARRPHPVRPVPRDCRLHEGQRGACFVRQMVGGGMVLTTYGRSSGFCIDPIEKKPLNHFTRLQRVLVRHRRLQPGLQVLPELGHLQSRDMDRLMDAASPAEIAGWPPSTAAAASPSPTTTR